MRYIRLKRITKSADFFLFGQTLIHLQRNFNRIKKHIQVVFSTFKNQIVNAIISEIFAFLCISVRGLTLTLDLLHPSIWQVSNFKQKILHKEVNIIRRYIHSGCSLFLEHFHFGIFRCSILTYLIWRISSVNAKINIGSRDSTQKLLDRLIIQG